MCVRVLRACRWGRDASAALQGRSGLGSAPAPPLVDAWVAVHGEGSGGAPTFPTDAPTKRIDFVAVGRGGRAASAATIGGAPGDDGSESPREGVGMLGEDSALWASDHLGVVVDVEVAAAVG